MSMTVINVVPSDYPGDPRSALGYCWRDYAARTPGDDVVAEYTADGIDYMAAAWAKMAEMGVTRAFVNCMWCGGFSGEIAATEEPSAVEQPAPLTAGETAAHVYTAEKNELAEMDARNAAHPGYCTKCHSYCYGDCEANS